MAPIIPNAMPADNLDMQHYVAQDEVAITGAMDAKTIEQQNAFQPSLAQDSDKEPARERGMMTWGMRRPLCGLTGPRLKSHGSVARGLGRASAADTRRRRRRYW